MSKVTHYVTLSSGKILAIEEGPQALHIATTGFHDGEIDAYICEINPSGVLVMPNSGDATHFLTEDLRIEM